MTTRNIQKKEQRTPAQLLCDAIGEKVECFCGNRPDLYLFIPGGFLQSDFNPFLNIRGGMKIYIELKTSRTGAYYNTIHHRAMFLIDIGYVTDHTNIVRSYFFKNKGGTLYDECHEFVNLSVSITQVSNFLKEFLTYLHFGDILLKTISNPCSISMESMRWPPSKNSSDFWRWVTLART